MSRSRFLRHRAWLFETNAVHWTSEFVLSVIWLAVVLSIGSIGLVLADPALAATSVASLFYLVPAVTAIMAYACRRAARCRSHRGMVAAPPRCFWSTGAPGCDEAAVQIIQNKSLRAFVRRLLPIMLQRSALRFLAFFFFCRLS